MERDHIGQIWTTLSAQSGLIGAPEPMKIEAVLGVHIGGSARVSQGVGLITEGSFGTRWPRGRIAGPVRPPAAQGFGAGKRALRGALLSISAVVRR